MKLICPHCSSEGLYQPISCTHCAQPLSPPLTKKEKFLASALFLGLVGSGMITEKTLDYFSGETSISSEEIALIYTSTQSCLNQIIKKDNIQSYQKLKLERALVFCTKTVEESLN